MKLSFNFCAIEIDDDEDAPLISKHTVNSALMSRLNNSTEVLWQLKSDNTSIE